MASFAEIEEEFITPSADGLERQVLNSLSAGKRDEDSTRRLVSMQQEHEQRAKHRLAALVRQFMERIDADWGEFNYDHREELARQAADVKLPDSDKIGPIVCHQLHQQLSQRRIAASGLARDAQARRLAVEGYLKRAEQLWGDITTHTVEWRAAASGAGPLAPLVEEANRAERHARFCQACLDSLSDTLLELHWMMENWDRLETGQPTRPAAEDIFGQMG